MTEIFTGFLKKHIDRLVFMFLALIFAGLLFYLNMTEEAKVIFIGLGMLCYNKARGSENK